MSGFFKKFLQFAIGPISGTLIGLITIPITTYFISPTELGRAAMFTLAQSLMGSFLYLGLDQAYTREFNVESDKDNLLLNAMLFPFSLAFLVTIFFFVNSYFISSLLFDGEYYRIPVYLTGITAIFIVFERFVLLRLRMEEKAIEFSMRTIMTKIITLVTTIIFVTTIRRDFIAIVFSVALGQILADLVLFYRYRKMFKVKNFKFDKGLQKRLWKFGLPIIASVGIGSALSTFDRISLRAWSDFEQLGLFTAATKVTSLMLVLQGMFTTFWVPTAYRWHEEKKDLSNYQLVSDGVLALMSIGFVLLLLFKSLIILLISEQYREAIYFIGFLSLYPLLYTLSETTTLGIVFSRKSYFNILVSIIAVIPNLILNFFLVPHFGALGAAIGSGVSYIFFFLARTYFSFKEWGGFSIKKHILIIIFMVILSVINTQSSRLVYIVNLISLFIILFINRKILKMGIEEFTQILKRKKLKSKNS